jgi:hypothetical protein
MLRLIRLAGIVYLCCAFNLPAADTAGDRVFDRLKRLAGEWEGTYEWSQGRNESGKLKANYYLTGNGSALVENLIMGDAPTMTTVYHLDGVDLRMTHYCAARNQPRLKATQIDESAGTLEFSFVDVTNASVSPAYVNAFRLQFLENDRLNLRFTFGGGSGNGAIENMALKRVAAVHS